MKTLTKKQLLDKGCCIFTLNSGLIIVLGPSSKQVPDISDRMCPVPDFSYSAKTMATIRKKSSIHF